MIENLIGLLAAILTTACWLPQLWHSWRTKSTEDLSWGYITVFGLGIILWGAYGLITGAAPLVLANATILLLLTGLIGMKISFEKQPHTTTALSDSSPQELASSRQRGRR